MSINVLPIKQFIIFNECCYYFSEFFDYFIIIPKKIYDILSNYHILNIFYDCCEDVL